MINTPKSRDNNVALTIKRAGACLAATAMMASTTLGTSGCKGVNFGNVMSMSKSQEIDLGQQSAKEVEQKAKIITSGPDNERLQRVAARILPLARRDYDVPFSVKLIDSKDVNAFALPGGPIYFYKGLMDLASSDDEVASVLGHEATHIVKRHSVKQISDSQTKGLIASLALGKSSDLAKAATGIVLQLDQLRFSRGDETEADENGFRYLTKAGYNPESMASFFRKMGAKTGNGGIALLQSHPLTSKRIEAAERRAKAYEAAQANAIPSRVN